MYLRHFSEWISPLTVYVELSFTFFRIQLQTRLNQPKNCFAHFELAKRFLPVSLKGENPCDQIFGENIFLKQNGDFNVTRTKKCLQMHVSTHQIEAEYDVMASSMLICFAVKRSNVNLCNCFFLPELRTFMATPSIQAPKCSENDSM